MAKKIQPDGFEIYPGVFVRVYDADGVSDRYTVVVDGIEWSSSVNPGSMPMLGLSGAPEHPQGVSQYTEGREGAHLGKKISFGDLPENVQRHVRWRLAPESP
jgi:hypothetical protein